MKITSEAPWTEKEEGDLYSSASNVYIPVRDAPGMPLIMSLELFQSDSSTDN